MTNKFSLTKHALGFYEVHPKPSITELTEHYAKKYYQENSGSYAQSYSKEELRYFDVCGEIALTTIHRYQAPITQDLLDLGCGEGFFAKIFSKEGWKTTLVDFSDDGLSRHNPSLIANLFEIP